MKKNKIIFGGIIILILVMISGVTFSLWQITLKQESENSISTSCFKIAMKEENPIHIQSAYPISDEEGLSLIPFTFTIENVCETYASFQINLEVLNETELSNLEFLKVSFESIDEVRKPVFLTTKKEVSPTLKDEMKNPISKKAYKLESGYLEVGEKRSYNISLWLDENTPALEEIMSKSFLSKISVIATYIKDYDKEKPITNVEVTNLTTKLKVDAKSSTDNTNIKYYYYSLDGENFVKTKESEYTFEVGSLEYGSATETIKALADSLEEEYTVYVKTEDEYGNVSEVVSKKIMRDFAYDRTTDNNLRYIGANPNNYVLFNNELWRVIGVMENVNDGGGKIESRLKLIRNDSIGNYSWDSSSSSVNSGDGVNEWSISDINVLLNQFYYNRLANRICYNGSSNANIPCSFVDIGFKEESKSYIENAVWYTGTNGSNDFTSSNNGTPRHFYTYERSNNSRKICSGGGDCNDNAPTTTRWTGAIGLIYPSDYGYATSGGGTQNYTKCLNMAMSSWASTDCSTNNWLKGDRYMSLITPYAHLSHSDDVFYLGKSGDLRVGFAQNAFITYPTVYLKAITQIIAGLGTIQNPYVLAI